MEAVISILTGEIRSISVMVILSAIVSVTADILTTITGIRITDMAVFMIIILHTVIILITVILITVSDMDMVLACVDTTADIMADTMAEDGHITFAMVKITV